eukprot:5720394-Pyramimonas_sp.AAC.1
MVTERVGVKRLGVRCPALRCRTGQIGSWSIRVVESDGSDDDNESPAGVHAGAGLPVKQIAI